MSQLFRSLAAVDFNQTSNILCNDYIYANGFVRTTSSPINLPMCIRSTNNYSAAHVLTEEHPIPFCTAKRKRGNCFPRLVNYFLLNYPNRTLKGETEWANCSGGAQKMRPKMKLFALCFMHTPYARVPIGIVRSWSESRRRRSVVISRHTCTHKE